MTQRPPIAPAVAMAARLARLDPVTRTSPGLAAAALASAFPAQAVRDHLAEAMAVAPAIAEALASDRPWALALGHARDVVAAAVLAGFGAYLWAVLP